MISKSKKFFFSLHRNWMDEGKYFSKLFLFLPSFFFKGLVKTKNFFYDKGLLKAKRAKIPVISIGNIIAGGSGKTPVTLALIKNLLERSIKVGVVSRGYQSQKENENILGCMGKGPLYLSDIIGDEPYLMAKRYPSIFLGVGKKRLISCQKLFEKGVEVALLDDGMQHRKLYRDLEIVVLHGEKIFGGNAFLPRGYLREDPKRLNRADLVLINHTKDFSRIKNIVKLYSKKPICFIGPKISGVYSLDEKQKLSIKNNRIGVFCSIADPKPFIRLLKEAGAIVVETLFGLDHEPLSNSRLQMFAKRCKKAGAVQIICTEKDQVKLLDSFKASLPVGYVKMDIEFLHGKENWELFMDKLINIMKK